MPISDYRTALVTGASSGIGAATVERLCQEGVTVHALAPQRRGRSRHWRRAHRLHPPCGRRVGPLPAITTLAESTEFDILVNNAGVDHPGLHPGRGRRAGRPAGGRHLRAVLQLCRLVVPGMAARNHGHVVNISSIAASYHFGGNATYHATKAAVHMLSRQLRVDLFGKLVRGDGNLSRPGRH